MKVASASVSSAVPIKDCGASRSCPRCNERIDNTDVTSEWPGFPGGVKFEPTDEQLLDHLAAKCGVGNMKPHIFLDYFIPTLEGDLGINYSHPKDLPGSNKDGICIYFFHKNVKAYVTGQRKRRKICANGSLNEEPVRWHKTGKTKPVVHNGVLKGCKKIMVLYKSAKNGSKPEKSNWVLHQYHLGTEAEEAGDYVVSKIFYQQQKQTEKNDEGVVFEGPDHSGLKNDENVMVEEAENSGGRTSPRTPKVNPPAPPGTDDSVIDSDTVDDFSTFQSSLQGLDCIPESSDDPALSVQNEVDTVCKTWLAGESQALELTALNSTNDTLLCEENIEPSSAWKNEGYSLISNTDSSAQSVGELMGRNDGSFALCDLENIELGTPPDFPLTDLQFGSQDSFLGWLDHI